VCSSDLIRAKGKFLTSAEARFLFCSHMNTNITEAMGVVLVADAAGARAPTRDLEAYQLYLRGRFSRSQRTS
jgi:hypothetical protein